MHVCMVLHGLLIVFPYHRRVLAYIKNISEAIRGQDCIDGFHSGFWGLRACEGCRVRGFGISGLVWSRLEGGLGPLLRRAEEI